MNTEQFFALYRALVENTNLNKIGAHGGTKLYADTALYTGVSFTSFVVRANTVVTSMSGSDINGRPVDFLTEFNIGGAAALIQNDLFIAPSGYRITSFQLTSGSILAYS